MIRKALACVCLVTALTCMAKAGNLPVRVKFVNTPAEEAINAVFSACGDNVIFQTSGEGKPNTYLTIEFKNPVSCKVAEEAVVKAAGLYLVKKNGYYIVMDKKLRSEFEANYLKIFKIHNIILGKKEGETEGNGGITNENKRIVEAVKTAVGKDGSVTVDEKNNYIIVRGTRDAIQRASEVIKAYDIPKKQIKITAKIVEIDTKVSNELGSDFVLSFFQGKNKTAVAGSYGFYGTEGYTPWMNSNTGSAVLNPIMPGTLALGILNKSQTLRLELGLRALELEGKAREISSPSILVFSGDEGRIEQGIEIPYREVKYAADGSSQVTVKFKKASLILDVLPIIDEKGRIVMDISLKKDSPNYEVAQVTGEPGINTRNITSRVRVKPGDSIVIGGIYTKDTRVSKQGVPILKEIPLIGWLFKSQTKEVSENKVYIILTPHVLED